MKQLDDGRWWCEKCDPDKVRLLPVSAKRNCSRSTGTYERPEPPEPIVPEDIAERTYICGICPTKRNIDGHCTRKTCGGQSHKIPVEQLCREARGCPEYHW